MRKENIVQYVDASADALCMEYIPLGNLRDQARAQDFVTEEIMELASQMTDALAYLHSKKVLHRDIKPENILLKSRLPLKIKLSDFGLATQKDIKRTFCGSLLYVAPELWKRIEYHDRADVWSLGVVISELLKKLPTLPRKLRLENFDGLQWTSLVHKSAEGGDGFQQLRAQMLQITPSLRPSAAACHERLVTLKASTLQEQQPLVRKRGLFSADTSETPNPKRQVGAIPVDNRQYAVGLDAEFWMHDLPKRTSFWLQRGTRKVNLGNILDAVGINRNERRAFRKDYPGERVKDSGRRSGTYISYGDALQVCERLRLLAHERALREDPLAAMEDCGNGLVEICTQPDKIPMIRSTSWVNIDAILGYLKKMGVLQRGRLRNIRSSPCWYIYTSEGMTGAYVPVSVAQQVCQCYKLIALESQILEAARSQFSTDTMHLSRVDCRQYIIVIAEHSEVVLVRRSDYYTNIANLYGFQQHDIGNGQYEAPERALELCDLYNFSALKRLLLIAYEHKDLPSSTDEVLASLEDDSASELLRVSTL